MGVAFHCPAHPDDAGDLLVCWFDNPGDAGEPVKGSGFFVHRVGDELEHLSLLPRGEGFGLLCFPHWRGWVIDGEANSAR
jgi:hypothetical protein